MPRSTTPSPILRQPLPTGEAATLRLALEATVLAMGDERVYSYDLAGRPFALVRDGWTSRRALNGRILQKRPAEAGAPRLRRRISAEEGTATVEAARRDAAKLLRALERSSRFHHEAQREALRRLRTIVGMDGPALAEDARRFVATYGTVGILPPDQYLSLLLRLTEGCSWNACSFCTLYRDVPFRVRTPPELGAHIDAVRAYFGASRLLRRALFLGDANALCVGHERLLPLLDQVASAFPLVPHGLPASQRHAWLEAHPDATTGLYAFVDAWTGHRKGVAEYRDYARLGLKRVYVGLESGDADLLAWLDKAGSPEHAVLLVHDLHAAGIAVGVIVLVGAGGERFHQSHVRHTAAALGRMGLGPTDILYFSQFVGDGALEYGRRASSEALRALPPERCLEQQRAILDAWPHTGLTRPRVATYDIHEFVY